MEQPIPNVVNLFRGGTHSKRSLGGHYFVDGQCDCGLTITEHRKRWNKRNKNRRNLA